MKTITAASLLLACLPLAQARDRTTLSPRELSDLTIEDLTSIEITSVSRRAERLNEAAASVHVITAQSIRRSGVTALPEALRLAANLRVAGDPTHQRMLRTSFNLPLRRELDVSVRQVTALAHSEIERNLMVQLQWPL